MPQMFPILWMPLYIYFIFIFFTFIIMNFYTNIKPLKLNFNKIKFNKNLNHWMW
nr:ATP synthase F0 subunit 8 [Fenusa (Kaliofenusa) sp. 3 GYN-2022b]